MYHGKEGACPEQRSWVSNQINILVRPYSPQLEKNPEVPLATQKEALLHCANMRGSLDPGHNSSGTPRFQPQLEKNHEIPP